jgi:hypothetical protein
MGWLNIIPKLEDCRASVPDALAFHRNALQIFHRVANVVESHVIRDIRRADAWRDDEADFSAFEFFVEPYRIENLLPRKFRWQPRW